MESLETAIARKLTLKEIFIPCDADLYKTRNRIERCFHKLKHLRRIVTRFDHCDIYFLAFLYLASFLIWTR